MVVVRHIAAWCNMVPRWTWLIAVASICLKLVGYAWKWPVDACRFGMFYNATLNECSPRRFCCMNQVFDTTSTPNEIVDSVIAAANKRILDPHLGPKAV
jgi:hypothetical protein